MVSTSTDIFHRAGVEMGDKEDQARRAVKAFRSLQPTLTAYARMLTKNPRVRVEMAARDNGSTDGNRIFMRPPMALGDNTVHVRRQCDKRDEDGLLRCTACRIREMVLVTIYHEIAHISFDSFAATTDEEQRELVSRAVAEHGGKYAKQIEERINSAPSWVKGSYMGMASLVSEFLPMLVNCLEDARVNRELFRARAGTKQMFDADTARIFREGVEQRNPQGELVSIPWTEYPQNAQAMVGMFCKASGYKYETYFIPPVVKALDDPELTRLINTLETVRSASGVYSLSFPVLARLRELGFCQLPDDPEPEPAPEPEPDNEDTDGDTDDTGPEEDSDDPEKGDGAPDPDATGGSQDDDGSGEGAEPGDMASERGDDDDDADGESAGSSPGDGDDEPAETPGPGGGPGDGDSDEASPEGEGDPAEGEPSPGANPEQDDRGEGGSGQASESDNDADPAPGSAGGESSDDSDAEADQPGAGGSADESDIGNSGGEGDDQAADGDSVSESTPEGGADADSSGSDLDGDEGGSVNEANSDGSPGSSDGDEAGEQLGGGGEQAPSGEEDSSREDEDPAAGGSPDGGASPDADGDDGPEPGSDGPGDTDGNEGEAGEGEGGDHAGITGTGDIGPDSALDEGSGGNADADSGRPDSEGSGGDAGPGADDDGEPLRGQEAGLGGDADDDDSDAGAADDGGSGEGDDTDKSHLLGGDATPDPLATDGEETIDTGADDGQGGTMVIEDEAYDDVPMGTPAEAKAGLLKWGDHEEKPKTVEEKADEAIVDKAIIQGIYFETPSKKIWGVREHRFGQPIMAPAGDGGEMNMSQAWDHDLLASYGYSMTELGIEGDFVPQEALLGPALLRMRVTFSANHRGSNQRNLKSGRINGRSLAKRVPAEDPRMFRKKTQPGKRNYFVLIGIDVSGSTTGTNIVLIKKAAYAQAELCHRMGIPFAIYAHSGNLHNPSTGRGEGLDLDMYLVKEVHEPWDSKVKERLTEIGPDAANLDGHTMEYYRKVLDTVEATDKIILYYTDGKMPAENHDEELEILQRELKICDAKGYTVLGVGIRTDSPTRHGLDTVQVDSEEEVIKVVKHLERRLLRA